MKELIVGTYEGFLLGYSLISEAETNKLKQTFATHSHTASVRCLSTAGKFLASGGTDDKIVIIDLKTRKEHTVLMNHNGSINVLAFTHNGTHLLSGSDDGSIIVTRTGNWQIEKIWNKAHGGQTVTNIAVHPSDKLALSIGGDKTLRTWNLIKGRPAFTINLSSKLTTLATEIKFSPGGDRFSLISHQTVDVWTISKAGMEKRITCNSKPICVQWVSDERMFVGLETGKIISLTISDTEALTYPAYKQRVKCIHYENEMLYSVSSSGELKVWSMSDTKLNEICSINAGCRVTCLNLNSQVCDIKREEKEQSDEEEVEEKEAEINVSVEMNQMRHKVSKKRKPGAFVAITYGNADENTTKPSHHKKSKKRKRNNAK